MEPSASVELEPVLQHLSQSGASYDRGRILRAYTFARCVYGDCIHWTGVPLIEHTLGILGVLAPFEPDEDAVVACILHHVLDAGAVPLLELEDQFGAKVRSLVSGLHLLSHVTLEGRRRSTEDLRIMLLSVSDDIRIILIALCDRCYCLSFLHRVPGDRAKRLCHDILQLFAPVAARLGIYSLKHALENGAFPVVYPDDARKISDELEHLHRDFPGFLEAASSALKSFLREQRIPATVEAREKHPYSVFLKMKRKALSNVRDVHDLFALRVIVDCEEDCYRVLGLLHRMGRPVAIRFKDYISFQKPNGYQSLHTTLSGFSGMPDGAFIEVQIRTTEMHREAQYGVAAHWSYKELGTTERAIEAVQLQSMIMSQQSIGDDDASGLADHIFVLTPKGDIVELPEGATPLDFAFQVHTDLGLSFRSARVNGSIAPLDYELQNGDVVEIQKHAVPRPSPQWMQQLKMASNRGKLRRYLQAREPPKEPSSAPGRLEEMKGRKRPPEAAASPHRGSSSVHVEGDIRMPIRYAKCCEPDVWPHGPIVGNISRIGAVMVHRAECRMAGTASPARSVGVQWADVLAESGH